MKTLLLLMTVCFFNTSIVHAATIPQIVAGAGRELDRQIVDRLGQSESPAAGVSLILTTPVNINDFTESNTLAKQVQEEIALWFTQAGYSVKEIRKGSSIIFEPDTGEMLLTRERSKLASKEATSDLTLIGTYTITPLHIRFNFKLLETASQEVIAMSGVTVPITFESASLINNSENFSGTPIEPTVITMLP